jgi:transposase
MGNRHISNDLKMAALRLSARGRDTMSEILDIVRFSRRTFYRVKERYRRFNTVAKAQAIGKGRPRKAMPGDIRYLIRLAHHKPTLFLDEYQSRLDRYRLLVLSMTTIHRELRRAGLSIKRVQKLASERDPIKRADFIRRIAQYPASYIIALDEVSKDDRTYAWLWGRSERGTHVEVSQPFVRKRRFSMLAGMVLDEGIVAAQVVEGSFNRDLFLTFLREDLVSSFDIGVTCPF